MTREDVTITLAGYYEQAGHGRFGLDERADEVTEMFDAAAEREVGTSSNAARASSAPGGSSDADAATDSRTG